MLDELGVPEEYRFDDFGVDGFYRKNRSDTSFAVFCLTAAQLKLLLFR